MDGDVCGRSGGSGDGARGQPRRRACAVISGAQRLRQAVWNITQSPVSLVCSSTLSARTGTRTNCGLHVCAHRLHVRVVVHDGTLELAAHRLQAVSTSDAERKRREPRSSVQAMRTQNATESPTHPASIKNVTPKKLSIRYVIRAPSGDVDRV
jgi:hypothetical protein